MFSFPQILPDPTSLTTQLYISVGWFFFWDRREKEGKREGEFFLVGCSYESLQVWGWLSSFVWHPTFSSLLSAIFYDLPPFLSHTPSGHKVPGDLSSTWNLPSSFLPIAGAHSVCYSCFYLSTGRWVSQPVSVFYRALQGFFSGLYFLLGEKSNNAVQNFSDWDTVFKTPQAWKLATHYNKYNNHSIYNNYNL